MDACPAWASSEPRCPMNSNVACSVDTLSCMVTTPHSGFFPGPAWGVGPVSPGSTC